MKKLLGIVVLGLLLSGNAHSNNNLPGLIFTSGNCSISTWSFSLKINAENRIMYFQSYNEYIKSLNIPISKIDNSGKIYAQTITYLDIVNTQGQKLNKWARLGYGNTLLDISYNPNTNQATIFTRTIRTSDKKILKGFRKAFGYESLDESENISCQNLQVLKKSETKVVEKPKKQKPKPSPDDNKVVPAGSGSGFFVSRDGHIITNHHVIDGCNITKVSFKGNQIDAQILAVDKMNDIAILKTNIKPSNIFPISNEDVSLLEDVVVAGYPLGKQVSSAIKTHKGVVTALAGAGDNYSNFQTDATINAGNSGGPIMNQKGNIVGIAVQTWVEEGVQGIHFGIKSSTLKTFASSNSLKFSQANNRELSNKDLGKLITEATVYIECHMTIAKIKKMIAQADNRKAFFSEFK